MYLITHRLRQIGAIYGAMRSGGLRDKIWTVRFGAQKWMAAIISGLRQLAGQRVDIYVIAELRGPDILLPVHFICFRVRPIGAVSA